MRTGESCLESSRKISFIATGEVLNERPMSQHRQALKIVEKEAGLEGYLLRPLSAKLLEPTQPEIKGLVARDKLMDISGRSRQRQMELAKEFGITDYPTPAGGCMLTQDGFVRRLKELMANKPDFNPEDAELVKIGRHFWHFDKLSASTIQIILGRNKEENEILLKGKRDKDIIIEPENFIGPTALIRGKSISNDIIERTKELVIKFSPKAKQGGIFNFVKK